MHNYHIRDRKLRESRCWEKGRIAYMYWPSIFYSNISYRSKQTVEGHDTQLAAEAEAYYKEWPMIWEDPPQEQE